MLDEFIKRYPEIFVISQNNTIIKEITSIESKWDTVNKTMKEIKSVLDSSIYGHNRAKRQIERVIGQWITGKQSGYCFGFEGPPGVGKTSLARKGLANCLKDKDGTTLCHKEIEMWEKHCDKKDDEEKKDDKDDKEE